jgi:hypothetical protein
MVDGITIFPQAIPPWPLPAGVNIVGSLSVVLIKPLFTSVPIHSNSVLLESIVTVLNGQ